MNNWKDEIDLRWTLRDIDGGRLKLTPITEDQLRELLELELVQLQDTRVSLTEAGRRRLG
jgi:hypothetical protein